MNQSIKNLDEVKNFSDFNIHESFRAHMFYEEITGESFKPTNLKSVLIFFYSNIMACNRELPVDFEAFIDWLDNHTEMLMEFTDWLTSSLTRTVTKQPAGEEAGEKEPFQNK